MTAPIPMDDFLAHLNRPGATPAPWPATTPADPPQYPHTPWRPRVTDVFPVATDPALDPEPTVDELLAECRQIRVDLAVAVARSRRARGADGGDIGRAA